MSGGGPRKEQQKLFAFLGGASTGVGDGGSAQRTIGPRARREMEDAVTSLANKYFAGLNHRSGLTSDPLQQVEPPSNKKGMERAQRKQRPANMAMNLVGLFRFLCKLLCTSGGSRE